MYNTYMYKSIAKINSANFMKKCFNSQHRCRIITPDIMSPPNQIPVNVINSLHMQQTPRGINRGIMSQSVGFVKKNYSPHSWKKIIHTTGDFRSCTGICIINSKNMKYLKLTLHKSISKINNNMINNTP